MANKIFTTYADQIKLLQSRGLNIDTENDKKFANEVLKRVGYYGLINGYKKPFIDSTCTQGEKFKEGTTIQEIYALYEFDRQLREIFMSYILKFEKHIKSVMSYHFSKKYGHDNYLLYKNFDTSAKEANVYIPDLIAEINRQVSYRTNDPCIFHYLTTYGYIPFWVLNNILTFGTISKFYNLLKLPDKTDIAREFKIQPHDLENFLKYLSSMRNFCAHGNRLFCYFSKRSLNNTKYHKRLNIPNTDGNYKQGKQDLFAAVIALKVLLSNDDYQRFANKLKSNISIVSKSLKTITPKELLSFMGFPENWSNL